MGTRARSRAATARGGLFRRASGWQQAVVVVCALVALHGIYVLFVPGVRLAEAGVACPSALVATFAGGGGLPTPDGLAPAAHDAACAAAGRWWLFAAGTQTAIAGLWLFTVLQWGRWRRRARRHRRRQARQARQVESASTSAAEPGR